MTGGCFRRYLRLMLPTGFILSLHFFAVKFKLYKNDDLRENKSFIDFLLDATVGTWYGAHPWCSAVWTIRIELLATFMVLLLALVASEYSSRFYIYTAAVLYNWSAYFISI